MSLIISDTSPLNLLIRIRQVHVLPSLFGRVVIPRAVIEEMQHPKAPDLVHEFIEGLPEWISIQDPSHLLLFPTLDPGEASAISLAVELKAPLMIDERDGREIARLHGLDVIGAIGVLERAANAGFIDDLEAVYHMIRALPFHISEHILDESLNRHRSNLSN